jgi:transposase
MKSKDIIVASTEELKRLHIMQMLFEKKIGQKEAASLLGLSTRQVRRIAAIIKVEGNKAIAHKLRGKPSNRKKSDGLKEKVLNLYRTKYSDFGPTFATEKLAGLDKIKIGKETLRRWLMEAGLHKKRRKPRPHRLYRERKQSFGEMAQVDGSEHAWFEDRGPKASFLGFIDDATNNVFGRFYTHEGTMPALDCFYRYAQKYGLPVSVYIDKHTTYRSTAKPSLEEELNGLAPQSQFQRALSELGVKIIYANSPQAKGRIERLFETFQDRLVKELKACRN